MIVIIRRHYIFYGFVQGVGFRYRAFHAAELFGVSGYVRNLDDGSVEMEAQGSEESIDKLIAALGQSRYISIDRMSVGNIPTESGGSFEIKD